MFKKLMLSLSLVLFSNHLFAMEFLGQTLEDLNRVQLTALLKQNGATTFKQEKLVDTFTLEKGKIPYAKWGQAYYNFQGEFVGLKIVFSYQDDTLINLRTTLVQKYGTNYIYKEFFGEHSNSKALEKPLFFDSAKWKFPNNTSIEYNAKSSDQPRIDNNLATSFSFLFFRHEGRKIALIEKLKEQSAQSDATKFKGVF